MWVNSIKSFGRRLQLHRGTHLKIRKESHADAEGAPGNAQEV